MSAYDDYMLIAKRHVQAGSFREALGAFKSAQKIYDNEKVRRRIKKVQETIKDEISEDPSSSNNDPGFQNLQNGLKIDRNIFSRLYRHQVEGVQFMWNNIHCQGVNGGMLSDDMGLGKTIQGKVQIYIFL